jgi:hypothetical protein
MVEKRRGERPMNLKLLQVASLGAVTIGVSVFVLSPAFAEEGDAALATAVEKSPTTLVQGLKASEKSGRPISAKFEIDQGKLQLSIYTMTGDGYQEVVVTPADGSVGATKKITDADDLKAANAQKAAMEKATVSLTDATEKAVRQNMGSHAVSVFPELKSSQPVATVTLSSDGKLTAIPQKLD